MEIQLLLNLGGRCLFRNVREFEFLIENDIFDIIMRELENDK